MATERIFPWLWLFMASCESSKWYGYLQSLPAATVDLALFWGTEQSRLLFDAAAIADGIEASAWLQGTEVEKELRNSETGEYLLKEIDDYYDTVVLPLSEGLGLSTTIAGYYRAYSLVSSRAFLVDAYHGLAMVPIADAFDHANENHVHLESDFDVCVVCGALDECPHDSETWDASPRGSSSSPMTSRLGLLSSEIAPSTSADCPSRYDADNTCDMVSNIPVIADTEVFNTYGERLSNASLLVRYGFMIEGNEWDSVAWTLEDVSSSLSGFDECPLLQATMGDNVSSDFIPSWSAILQRWEPRDTWTDSNLVFCSDFLGVSEMQDSHSSAGRKPLQSPAAGEGSSAGSRPHFEDLEKMLSLNEDGKISHQLWVFCALAVLNQREGRRRLDVLEKVDALTRLAVAQLDVETQIFEDCDDMVSDSDDPDTEVRASASVDRGPRHPREQSPSKELLFQVGQTVERVCAYRLSKMQRAANMSCSQVAEALDDVPRCKPRTRLAMTQVINEMSLLETCISLWKQVAP
ncbi:hypothetical protein GLOTRDRAFT_138148 [Gloeophyllum trabeum ATCC 11539]|uniref:SET domain-containing protein n=1 Tax=Gloeophyllum trabeum (strain ATCC 11539 / FP-39264 / Madison 617) TaxID=670483 RepID=S7RTF1_GLOTA|nr:uncharacterized protein GLOTRDRAFT_138148 [Gloeophyllum trabeum ATCC 11539]EPQ56414.1 hypothetical protein GLOTRDRAFT_138148 [Gloeophyllum trabeum ATCC 11539]